MWRVISEEVVRIDVNLPDNPRQTQSDDTPVMAGFPSAAGLPSVHPFPPVRVPVGNEHAPPRLDQVFLFREEFVVGEEYLPSESIGGEIDEPRGDTRIPLFGPAHGLTEVWFAIMTSRIPYNHSSIGPAVEEAL